MTNARSLHLFLLRDLEQEQASWARADTIASASAALAEKTKVAVVVTHDYGWTLLPSGEQYADDVERPLPHWEFSTSVRGPADLKCIPEYIRALAKSRAPWRSGQVKVGPQVLRSTPLDLRSIPTTTIIGRVSVGHSGWRQPYAIDAEVLAGFNETDLLPISIGNQGLLILVPEEEPNLEVHDTIQVRLKHGDGYCFVTGQLVRKSVLVRIVTIDRCGSAYRTEMNVHS